MHTPKAKYILFPLLTLLILIPVIKTGHSLSAQQSNPQALQKMEQGKTALKNKNLVQANTLFTQAIAMAPNDYQMEDEISRAYVQACNGMDYTTMINSVEYNKAYDHGISAISKHDSLNPYRYTQSFYSPIKGEYFIAQSSGGKSLHFGLQNHYSYDIINRIRQDLSSGMPVLAVSDGVVKTVVSGNPDQPIGTPSMHALPNYVVIEHDNGVTSWYLHVRNNSITVREGQTIKASQKIAEIGNSGISTGPHLHFMLHSRDNISLPIRLTGVQTMTGTFRPSWSHIKNWSDQPKLYRGIVDNCSEGIFDGINCIAKYFHEMNLKENKQKYWYDKNFGALYKKGQPDCDEGRYDGVNCLVLGTPQMNLRDNKKNYWYDSRHGAIYKKAEKKRCDEGRFDGVNCKVLNWQDLRVKGIQTDYWYDKNLGALYKKPSPKCDEGRSDGVNCLVRGLPELKLNGPKDKYWYDNRFGHIYRACEDCGLETN